MMRFQFVIDNKDTSMGWYLRAGLATGSSVSLLIVPVRTTSWLSSFSHRSDQLQLCCPPLLGDCHQRTPERLSAFGRTLDGHVPENLDGCQAEADV